MALDKGLSQEVAGAVASGRSERLKAVTKADTSTVARILYCERYVEMPTNVGERVYHTVLGRQLTPTNTAFHIRGYFINAPSYPTQYHSFPLLRYQ